MRGLELGGVDLDAQAGLLRDRDLASLDEQRLLGEALAFLPDPVGVHRGDVAGRGGADVREHRERDVEVVVRMRSPGEAAFLTDLRDLHRALHGPEVRIGERDVDRLQLQRVVELTPVGGDHVRGGAEAGGLLELGHDLATGETGFGAAGVFGVGEHALEVLADFDGFLQEPGSVGVEGDAGLREAGRERADGFDLAGGAEHAALQLEVLEAEALLRGLGLADDGFRGEGFLVAEAMPGVRRAGFVAVAEGRLATVADEEQVSEHLDLGALLAFAEERRDGLALELTEEVEQGGFDRGDGVDGHAQVEGLQAATTGVTIREGRADGGEQLFVGGDLPADQHGRGILDGLADLLAAGDFTEAGAAGVVRDEDDVTREERTVRAAEVEQHAVMAGDGHDTDGLDERGGH